MAGILSRQRHSRHDALHINNFLGMEPKTLRDVQELPRRLAELEPRPSAPVAIAPLQHHHRQLRAKDCLPLAPRRLHLVFGWCVIWALGDYDSRYGGHLILWEPRLIIEFAPGDIIFLPSACITHASIPIREGEHRYSVTWYTSGQLFRYQALHLAPSSIGKPTEGSEATDPAEEGKRSCWMEGLDCFMSLDELKQHHTEGGGL